jgi:hypothetical protein
MKKKNTIVSLINWTQIEICGFGTEDFCFKNNLTESNAIL